MDYQTRITILEGKLDEQERLTWAYRRVALELAAGLPSLAENFKIWVDETAIHHLDHLDQAQGKK